MKKYIIIVFMFVVSNIFAQLLEPVTVKVTDKTQIEYQIQKLKKDLNKQFSKEVRSGKEPPFFRIRNEEIQIKKNKAIVNCEIIYGDYNKNKLLKKQQLIFNKNDKWQLDSYPQILGETIRKLRKTVKTEPTFKKSSGTIHTDIKSVEVIDLQLSNDVFIPYPIDDDGNTYEINSEQTNEELGVNLFRDGAYIDGCVYYRSYTSEDYFDRVVFYVDPAWKRIVYSREVNGVYKEIKGYDGDNNVSFIKPIAIDINEKGELFVLDEAKAVYKLQYNPSSHNIYSTNYSKIIDSQYLKHPSDISYSNRGTYNNTNDDYMVVSDLERKSLMLFNYSGILINEFNAYEGISITKPVSVEIIEQASYLTLNFVDGQRVVHGWSFNNSTLHATFSSPFPSNSKLNGIGLNSLFGGVEGMIVSDINNDMLHFLDPLTSEYICSYKGQGTDYFIAPYSIFSTAFAHYDHSNAIRLDFFTMDMWTSESGIKRFVPGADVLNINITRGEFKWILTFDETNDQTTIAELRDASNNNLISGDSQYAYDSWLIPGRQYKWIIKYKPIRDDMYEGYGNGWKTKEVTFTPTFTMPTNITENYTIDGSKHYTAYDDVIINNGVTLTIRSNTSYAYPGITFHNNSSLKVYGTLDAIGCIYCYKIVFDFVSPYNSSGVYNGIDILQGGTAIIKNAEIKNAQYGIRLGKTYATIENNDIHDCVIGTYLYWTNDYGYSQIHSNNIHDNTCCGIYAYYSKAKVRDNQIKDNGNRGVFGGNHSTLYLGEAGYAGNNNISNNTTVGIFADYSSYMFLGRETCTPQGGNNIIDNTSLNAKAWGYGSIIQAENTWWGSNSQSTITSKFYIYHGEIYYTPWLSSEPSGALAKSISSPEETTYDARFTPSVSSESLKGSVNDKKYNYDSKWTIYWKLLYARNLIFVEDYKFAREICREVIDENPDSSLSFWALNLLGVASYEDDPIGFREYLKKKTSTKEKKELYGSMELILAGYETTKSSKDQSINNTSKKYEGTYIEEVALLQKFMYYLNEEKDENTARSISNELDKKFSKSQSALEAHRLLGDEVKETGKEPEQKNSLNKTTDSLPKKYELLGNYPNPFNPSTTIRYALPFNSNVELTIYNLSGQMIKSLKISSQSSGYNYVVWNGTNNNGTQVTSGVYIYKFKAVSLEGNGEVFEEASKLMLVK